MFYLKSQSLPLVAAMFLLAAGSAMGAPLLPNIIMDIRDIAQGTNGTAKVLRFSTWTVNVGAGPLELRAVSTNPDGSQNVEQWIYDSNGTHTTRVAGTFAVVSGRLRFTDSADYFLKEVTAGNGIGGVVAGNQKQSYCIVDSQKYTTQPPGTPATAQYTTCGPTMGVSVGWADIYPSSFTNTQIIPLAGVSDGTYWLENTGDPLNRLLESNETDNTTDVQVTVTTGLAPEIDVIGNGQSIPNNDVAPSATDFTDFGNVDVTTDSLTRSFTIQNNGTGSLSLTGVPKVQITGSSDFTVTLQPVSPVQTNNNTTTFQIRFKPGSAGQQTATVSIVNNDANEGTYQFAIRGNGIPDSDGDLEDDISEAASGTDPNNPNSVVRTGKQLNISTRLNVLTGDNIGIGGFIISGSDPKTVAVRALGPSLTTHGVIGALADPTLELHDHTGAAIAFNNNWKDSPAQQTLIQNAGLALTNDLEAAMVQTLAPGGYTALVQGNGGGTGVGLIEIYDIDPSSNSSLANISTRGFASTGESVMIGGEIIGHGLGANGAGSAKIVVRALGPSLPASIPNRLQDPMLELRDGNGALVALNDDWQSTQQTEIQATGLAPTDIHESAILQVLTQGSYTAILSGKSGTVGVALVEAYKVQ